MTSKTNLERYPRSHPSFFHLENNILTLRSAGLLPVITVRNPFAWAIIFPRCPKDVENRSWSTNYRGPLLIHAGKAFYRDDVLSKAEVVAEVARMAREDPPQMEDMYSGHLIGMVYLEDCITTSESQWAMAGDRHFILSNPVKLKTPLPCPGRLGLWAIKNRPNDPNLIKHDVDLDFYHPRP